MTDSPTGQRRRSRSELRCWPAETPIGKIGTTAIMDDSRRRARSELRAGWSSSNSSDEDHLTSNNSRRFRLVSTAAINNRNNIINNINNQNNKAPEQQPRPWAGYSESSEGSDDSLPWSGTLSTKNSHNNLNNNNVVIDTIDAPCSPVQIVTLQAEPTTREQRMQRYKEARRRENEARRQKVIEEDAKRRKARAEENNNDSPKYRTRTYLSDAEANAPPAKSPQQKVPAVRSFSNPVSVRFEEVSHVLHHHHHHHHHSHPHHHHHHHHNNHSPDDNKNNNNSNNNATSNGITVTMTNGSTCPRPGILRTEGSERRSRARERRAQAREIRVPLTITISSTSNKDQQQQQVNSSNKTSIQQAAGSALVVESVNIPIGDENEENIAPTINSCEDEVAKLLERCQRSDRYVPVKEKLTLFESLSRMGGRLARSTEDLGRSSSNPSPRGKQRARSLHDLNRGSKSMPVREMCRFFESDMTEGKQLTCTSLRIGQSDVGTIYRTTLSTWKEPKGNMNSPCVKTATRRRQYART